MLELKSYVKREKGYTIIELLIVAAIIGILLAIALPNLIKARISANEASARKSMQTLRDAEGEFFEQDIDNNGIRDYTDLIGDVAVNSVEGSLRCPDNDINACTEQDALVDNSFPGAIPTSGDGTTAASADCGRSKAGYCIGWTGDSADGINTANWQNPPDPLSAILEADFGWEASPKSVNKTGRRDYGVFGDGVIRCSASTEVGAVPGTFQVSRDGSDGVIAFACD